jgi:hypothetical protein
MLMIDVEIYDKHLFFQCFSNGSRKIVFAE